MSYEINIIAINQKKPIHIEHKTKALLHNEIEDSEVNRYAEIWPFFSNTNGILYSIVEEINEGFYSAFNLCDSDFNTIVPKSLFSDWISDEAKGNLTPFIIRQDLYNEIVDIIQHILDSTPQKKILFQTRYQGGDEEVILGVIKMSKFKDMLMQKQILFNACYILEGD